MYFSLNPYNSDEMAYQLSTVVSKVIKSPKTLFWGYLDTNILMMYDHKTTKIHSWSAFYYLYLKNLLNSGDNLKSLHDIFIVWKTWNLLNKLLFQWFPP